MASSFIKVGFMAAGLVLSFSSSTSFAKEYYKWVDAKGSTHYTTTLPPKSAKKKGKVDTYGALHTTSHTTPDNNKAKEEPAQNTTIVSGEKVSAAPSQNSQAKPAALATAPQ